MAEVFVVDRAAFFGGDWPQGFVPLPDAAAFLNEALARGRFEPRDRAEGEPAWKQWIPYCFLRCGPEAPDAPPDRRGVFVVQRTRGQSEARLHESWSIGLGGHVEPPDRTSGQPGDGPAFFDAALWRELTEELCIPAADRGLWPAPRLVGLINDDSTAVGSVHAGLAYCLDVPLPLAEARERVGIREISKMRGGFTSLVEFAELWLDRTRFESWSQFLVEAGMLGAMGGGSWNGPTSAGTVTDLQA